MILAVGVYGKIILYDIGGRRRLRRTTAVARDCGRPLSLAFCPNGMGLASNYDNSVAFWHVAGRGEPGEPRVVSKGSNPRRVAISSDCARLAAGLETAGKYGIVMFDLTGRSAPKEAWNLEYGVDYFTFNPDGTELVLVRGGGTVEFLSAKDGRPLGKSLKIGEVLVKSLKIGEVSAESVIPRFGEGRIRSVAFNHDGTKLAVGYEYSFRALGGAVVLIDVSSGTATGPPLVLNDATPWYLAFAPDETLLAIGCPMVWYCGTWLRSVDCANL